MPLALWIVWRMLRALRATLHLLLDWRLLRRLPWAYFRRRARSDRWSAFLCITLGFSAACTLVAAVSPVQDLTDAAGVIGIQVALLGVLSSWIHALRRR